MQFGVRLEGIVKCNEERRLPDMLEDLSLCARVLRRLRLLHDSGLFQHLHGIQFTWIVPAHLAHQEHLAVGCPEENDDLLLEQNQR